MMEMTCTKCGAFMAEGVRFCTQCGLALDSGSPERRHRVIQNLLLLAITALLLTLVVQGWPS